MKYTSRKEALLNEYKGNLFEFLVAKEMAKTFSFEADFLTQFNEKSFETLSQQEDFIRNFFPAYLEFLPECAIYSANNIIKALGITSCENVIVVGKANAAKSIQDGYSEVDLILKSDLDIHCSLKFSKFSSFVNTKSAGIKSFIGKYFLFDESLEYQKNFTIQWDLEFENFARTLHKSVDIEYTSLFENWQQFRDEVLPGELEGELKEILHLFYEKINIKLAYILEQLYQLNNDLFKKSLLPLLGFSKENIVQVCLFYTKKDKRLKYKSIQIHQYSDILNALSGDISIKANKTNIEIMAKDLTLQIRMKPMNTFIQKGYKINCSVKFS